MGRTGEPKGSSNCSDPLTPLTPEIDLTASADRLSWTNSLHPAVTESRELLRHFLAALAYRTQKALRGAPESFAHFRVGPTSRTPKELVWHMTGVIGYARTMFHGGRFMPPELPTFADESLMHGQRLTFQAGTHNEAVTMSTDDYCRLAQPGIGRFATRS